MSSLTACSKRIVQLRIILIGTHRKPVHINEAAAAAVRHFCSQALGATKWQKHGYMGLRPSRHLDN